MKQIVLAAVQYREDYDQTFTYGYCGYIDANGGPCRGYYYWWPEALYPYIKNWQIFVCPSTGTVPPSFYADSGRADYAINQSMFYNRSAVEGRTDAEFGDPAGTIIFCEGGIWAGFWDPEGDGVRAGNFNPADTAPDPNESGVPWDDTTRVAERHNEGSNYGFYDGPSV